MNHPFMCVSAVDQNGVVLDILIQPKRDRFAAMRIFRKLFPATRRQPLVIITGQTGQLRGDETGVKRSVAHPQHRYLDSVVIVVHTLHVNLADSDRVCQTGLYRLHNCDGIVVIHGGVNNFVPEPSHWLVSIRRHL